VTENPEVGAPPDVVIPKPRVESSAVSGARQVTGPAARLCCDFLMQWPGSAADGGPSAEARAVVKEISELAVPQDSLETMASYAVLMDEQVQAVLRNQGYDSYSRVSQECDRQSRLGFEDDVVDACCAFVEAVRTGVGDGRVLADVNRFGYRAFACLTSICVSLAEALVRHSGEFGEYTDVVEWLRGGDLASQSR
jgi:hypothetical protein